MLCDGAFECLCSVFRNQENATEVDNSRSARIRVYSFVECFYSLHNSKASKHRGASNKPEIS